MIQFAPLNFNGQFTASRAKIVRFNKQVNPKESCLL